jgi:hypothetical protein
MSYSLSDQQFANEFPEHELAGLHNATITGAIKERAKPVIGSVITREKMTSVTTQEK